MFKNKNKNKLKNTIALKRSLYAIILSVIFIVAVVGLTIISTVFAERYPLEIDLTANKQHSISEENFDYISSVDKPINIYVALTENQYKSTTGSTWDMSYIAADSYFVEYSGENAVYYTQTVELLKKYQDYNKNITVRFLDLLDSNNNEIVNKFSGFSFQEGDILVESTFTVDGEDVTRRDVVDFDDVYTLKDLNGTAEQFKGNAYAQMYGMTATAGKGYGYFITENKIEAAISSAIYRVTSPNTPVFLVPTAISSDKIIAEKLESVLQINNIDIEYSDEVLSTVLKPENYDKYAGIILADCKSDISADERGLIEAFLDNNGKREKALYYFAGTDTVKLSNLCGLHGDWGIGFGEGILYETDKSWHVADKPTQIVVSSIETDYSDSVEDLGKYSIVNNMVYMKQLWPSNGTATYTRATEVFMRTTSIRQTTTMPLGAPEGWAPGDNPEYNMFPTAILSHNDDAVDGKYISSYVVAFASSDIISKNYTSQYANMDVTLRTFKEAVGTADSEFSFVPKEISTDSYQPSETSAEVIKWIFMLAIPVCVVSLGVVVWVRRKRK